MSMNPPRSNQAPVAKEKETVSMWRCRSQAFFLPAAAAFGETCWRPAVDVYRTRAGWLAKFDLAGVRPEDIRLHVEGHVLRVQGNRHDYVLEEGAHYHSLEIAYSRFERRVEFPMSLEQARITTEYQAGMLLVRIQTEGESP
jgi:HSP20 family protein